MTCTTRWSTCRPGRSPTRSARSRPSQVLAAVADAARAAHALHEAGIAHNDIKPGNVMLHDGHAKLSDLGLSQLLTPGLTITGLGSTGSVEYLDPAVIRGEMPGRATDIFALGATLHRALTGTGLYGDLPTDNTMLAMRRVLSHPAGDLAEPAAWRARGNRRGDRPESGGAAGDRRGAGRAHRRAVRGRALTWSGARR